MLGIAPLRKCPVVWPHLEMPLAANVEFPGEARARRSLCVAGELIEESREETAGYKLL